MCYRSGHRPTQSMAPFINPWWFLPHQVSPVLLLNVKPSASGKLPSDSEVEALMAEAYGALDPEGKVRQAKRERSGPSIFVSLEAYIAVLLSLLVHFHFAFLNSKL